MKLPNAHQVEYLLIGGYAVAYHGYPRATADMDIWIASSPQNAAKIVTALKEFGFDLPQLTVDLFLASLCCIIFAHLLAEMRPYKHGESSHDCPSVSRGPQSAPISATESSAIFR